MIFLKTLHIRLGIIFLYLCSLLPYTAIISIGKFLGKLSYYLFKKRRQVVLANLKHCFPQQTEIWYQDTCKKHIISFATGLMEQSICWWWSEERLAKYVEIDGLENFHAAKASNKGVILLFGHFTTLEMGLRILGNLEKTAILYRRHDTSYFDAFINKKRSRYISQQIGKESPLRMIRLLKDGGCIWFAPDQNYVGRGEILANFFGQVAPTTTATTKIVAMTGTKVVPVTTIRKPNSLGYKVTIQTELENFSDLDALSGTNQVNAVIEEMAKRNIIDYYWVHRRFKNLPPEYEDIYKSN